MRKWNTAVVSREEQRQQKRQAVLNVGVRLFNDRGYSQTSLDDIASELNITKRTIYYYVENKEEILQECIRIGIKFIEEIVELCANKKAPPLDLIRVLVEKYSKWLSQDIGAALVLTKEISLSPEIRTSLRDAKRALDTCLRGMIQAGIDDGSIRVCDPRFASAAIFGALNWVPFWNRDGKPAPEDQISSQFLDIFLSGLEPR